MEHTYPSKTSSWKPWFDEGLDGLYITWSILQNIRLIYEILGIFGWGRKTVLEASSLSLLGTPLGLGVLETQEELICAQYDKRDTFCMFSYSIRRICSCTPDFSGLAARRLNPKPLKPGCSRKSRFDFGVDFFLSVQLDPDP